LEGVSTPGIAKRTAVSLFDLRKKIAATKNVAQLTGVMKLVAASKLRGVEMRLAAGRPFGDVLMRSLASPPAEKKDDGKTEPKKHLLVVVTTDRGLCGGVNSAVNRAVRASVAELTAQGHQVKLFVLGEKGRSALSREFAHLFVHSFDSAFDKDVTFPLAAVISERIAEYEFDVLTVWYNRFESAAKFTATGQNLSKVNGLPAGKKPALLREYDIEPEDNEEALQNLMEYAMAGSLYGVLLSSQAAEMASRMTAMDSATNNATDMVDRYSLLYNRARQAKITTELVEIISGAESLQDGSNQE